MRESNPRRRSMALLFACGISFMPTVSYAQSFTGGPFTPGVKPIVTAPIAPTFNPQVIQQTTAPAPPVQTQATNQPAVRNFDTPVNFPAIFGNTILPTDTLPRTADLPSGLGHEDSKVGEPRTYEFGDLSVFLKGQGWNGGIADADGPELDEADAVIEDTSYGESAGIVPIRYPQSVDDAAGSHFQLCSQADVQQPVIIRVNEATKHLWVFTENNQFETGNILGCEDAFVSGLPGAVLGSRNGMLTLHKGVLIVDSGAESLKLATRAAGLKLPADSTAMVDYKPGRSVAVRILSCHGDGKAKIRLASQPDHVFELVAGEQLSVDIREGSATADASSIVTNFPLIGYVNSMPREVSGSASGRYKRMYAHVCGSEQVNRSHSENADKVLVAAAPVSLFSSEGTRFIAADTGHIGLLSGKVLVTSHAAQIIRTQMGDVYMQKNAVVSMERWQGELRVQCCSAPKSTILVSDKFGVPMTWGIETLILDHQPTWNDAFPNDGVGRRCFELHNLKMNNCIISDFSLPHLIVKGNHFHDLRTDNHDEARQLRAQLLKTAAALMIVTGYKGQYATKPPAQASTTQTN
jgi:hypothetical protein